MNLHKFLLSGNRKTTLITALGIILLSTGVWAQSIPVECFSYRTTVTINNSMVSGGSNLTDFPVMIRIQNANFRHIYHGGRITQYNGYDVIFAQNSNGTGILQHQIDTYDPVNGTYIAWVKIPSLSASANTIIYVFYGNYNISTDYSNDSVWSTDYAGVWHMGQSLADYSQAGNDGVNYGTALDQGFIGNARKFIRTEKDYVEIMNEPDFNFDTTMTLSYWMYLDSFPQTETWMDVITKGDNANFRMVARRSTRYMCYAFGTGGTEGGHTCDLNSANNSINTGGWYYVVGTWDGKQTYGGNQGLKRLYINGTLVNQGPNAYSIQQYTTNAQSVLLGVNSEATDSRAFSGRMDEVRISNAFKSDGWIITEYRNQNSPGTYITLSGDTPLGMPTAVGGTATCADNELFAREHTTVTLTGHTGTIQWQFSDNNIDFYDIPEATSSSYITTPLLRDTYFRAMVSLAGCAEASTVDSVLVNPGFITCEYDHRKRIAIPPNNVSGSDNLTNFPVLIRIDDDPELRQVGLGGGVEHPQGYDIIFTSSNGTTQLLHEVELYNGTDGDLLAWVNVPTLYANDTTTIYLYFGNSTVSVNPSTSATWNNNYIGVWHLSDMVDATGHGNTGTDNGTSSVTGRISNGRQFNGTSNYITIANESNFDVATGGKLSISAWIYVNAYSGSQEHYISKGTTAWYLSKSGATGTNPMMYNQYLAGQSLYAINTSGLLAGSWHHLAATFDHASNNMVVYIDGDAAGSAKNDPSSSGMTGNNTQVRFGALGGAASNYLNGRLDEVHIQNVFRSSDWLRTEYINQNNPTTFRNIFNEESCMSDPVSGTASVEYSKLCQGQTTTITLSGFTGNIYWQSSADGVNWNYLNGEFDSVLIAGPITDTMYYRASVAGCCELFSNSIRIDFLNIPPPTLGFIVDSVSCIGNSDGAINLTVSGGTNPVGYLWSEGSTTQDISNLITGIYTVTVSDGSQCHVTGSANVPVEPDITAPIATVCPSDLIASAGAGICTATLDPADPTFTDNCGVTAITWVMTGATSASSPGTGINYIGNYTFNRDTTTITYTARDLANNSTTCVFSVIVRDTQVPTVSSCPSNATRYSASGSCVVSYDPANPVFADNCAVSAVTWIMTGATTGNSPSAGLNYVGTTSFNRGITTITYTAADVSANIVNCIFSITVLDTVDPTITMPADIDIECIDDLPVPYANYAAFTAEGGSSADNCNINASTFTLVSSVSDGNSCPELITRRYSVQDSSGNSVTGIQTIAILDITDPVMTAPAEINIECRDDIPASYANYSAFATAGGTASDNCGLVTSTFAFVSDVSDNNSCPETITRTYTISDSCGNDDIVTQNIVIHDNTDPSISAPAGLNFECAADVPAAYATLAAFVSAGGSVNDNCGIDAGSFTLSDEQTTGSGDDLTITRTYSIADSCGNVAEDDQVIQVNDNTDPVITCPDDVTVCGDDEDGAIINGLALTTLSDNCTDAGDLVVDYAITGATSATGSGDASGTFFNNGTSSLRYAVTDESGNSTYCDITIIVNALPSTSGITGNSTPDCNATNENYSVSGASNSKYNWTVPSGTTMVTDTSASGVDNIDVNFGTISGNITVIEVSDDGCSGELRSLTITLQGCDLEADFSVSADETCIGNNVTVIDESTGTSGSTTYLWNFGSGADPATSTTSGNQSVVYQTSGYKTISLIITDGISSTETKTEILYVHEMPSVALETEDICGAGSTLYTASAGSGDEVIFSLDGGSTVAWTDNTAPYTYSATLVEGDTIMVWAQSTLSSASCSSAWVDATAIAYPVPVTGAITLVEGMGGNGTYFDIACRPASATYSVAQVSGITYEWEIPGSGIIPGNSSQIVVPWDVIEGAYTLRVRAVSGVCTGDYTEEQIYVSEVSTDLGDDIIICGDEPYIFELPSTYAEYLWQDGSALNYYTADATEEIWVRASGSYGCDASDTAMITYYPAVFIDLGEDTTLCSGSSMQIGAAGYNSYLWSTGATTPTITIGSESGTVVLTVTDNNTCTATDSIIITSCDPVALFGEIANTFTPNGDLNHDTWVINNIELFPNVSIKVFDRWGRLVYSVKGGYHNDWDGTLHGKELPMDAYYYIIDFNDSNMTIRKGTVTIVR